MNGTRYIASGFNEMEFNELNVLNELNVFNDLDVFDELDVFNVFNELIPPMRDPPEINALQPPQTL